MADEQPPNMDPSESARHDDDVFVAPPLSGDDLDDLADPPGWPKVVGTISIVLGAVSLTCGGCSLIMSALQGYMFQMAGMDPTQIPPTTSTVQWVAGGIGIAWTILLIIAGIMLLNRNQVSRMLFLVYAVGSFVLLLWSIKIQLDMAAVIAQWVQDNPDTDFAKTQQGPFAKIGPLIGVIFTIILGGPWPLFCLIWFGFIKREPDDMTGGLEPAA